MKLIKLIFPLILVLILLTPVLAQEVKIKTFVNDYADIIGPDEELELNSILNNLYEKNVAQFSVVTVKSLDGKDIESYSLNLAQEVLGDKEKNNGLLLLVSLEDKKYRFEVGRGLEATLNDARVGRIGREVLVPNFKNEEYGKGIVESVKAINGILSNDPDYEEAYTKDSSGVSNTVYIYILIYVVFLIISIIIRIVRYKKRKEGDESYYNSALGGAILLGGLGRGGGGGGFGGFGGGGFGGGGAGGGW